MAIAFCCRAVARAADGAAATPPTVQDAAGAKASPAQVRAVRVDGPERRPARHPLPMAPRPAPEAKAAAVAVVTVRDDPVVAKGRAGSAVATARAGTGAKAATAAKAGAAPRVAPKYHRAARRPDSVRTVIVR